MAYAVVVVCGLVILIVTHIYNTFVFPLYKRRQIINQHGCKLPQKLPFHDPLFGLDIIFESYRAHNSHSYLSLVKSRFDKYGTTFEARMLGRTVVNTIEPRNIQALLATQFNDFGLGDRRIAAFEPLLGHSIFTTDGDAWKHFRAMLRPSFGKQQVGCTDLLETHVGNMLHLIPRDGSTVDLQQLFFRLTIR